MARNKRAPVHLVPKPPVSTHAISRLTMLELHRLYFLVVQAKADYEAASAAYVNRLTSLCADLGIETETSQVNIDFLACELKIGTAPEQTGVLESS